MLAALTASDLKVVETCSHLFASTEDAVGGEFVQRGECRILAHGQAAGQPLGMAIRRHERGFAQKAVLIAVADR